METLYPLLFPLFVLWALGLLLLLFRGGLSWPGRISAVLIFAFYGFWFLDPILASFELYRSSLNTALPALFTHGKYLFGLGLLFAWPLAVFVLFRMGSPEQAEGVLRGLVLVTLFFWLFWLLNFFLAPWPMDMLKEMLPERLEMPDIPPPPVQAQ